MKVQKKLAKFKSILLFIASLLVLVFLPVSAMADTEKRGELQFKVDRIMGGNDEQTELRETELERTFPALFTEDVKAKIEDTERENQESMEELKESIFSANFEANSTVEDVKDSLFTEGYTAVASGGSQAQEETSSNSGLNNILLTVFSGLGLLLFGGLYFMMRSMFD
ncbi:type VII secretion protein EssA [Virgibacillus sp. YIM 98842]|uniref:type VII secretion protein EssA n=1 Tax=Virgibacillus sp. YIM 98842 TaxID=2663533 RepID=UPI0013DC00FA|nr:type VII secretion protein EssA [Virgibacillus sp. YIM 98842]